MSVFSIIKRGRAQAKEHNAKKAEKAREEAVKLPYKHVVTHAASDALAGAPSSWKDTDKPRIMEQNKRRTAIMDSETHMAGMPRVGSSLSYGSFASVYATPVVPLPRNYTYSNIPTSWREPLANFQDGRNSFVQSGSVVTSKGKEPEYIRPSSSAGPFPILPAGQSSTILSKGRIPVLGPTHIHTDLHIDMSFNGSSANLSGSDDELDMKNEVTNNHRSQGLGYRSSISQRSSPSSEKSYRTPLTSSGSTAETSVKADRHYPPPAQSTYFSAPRPLVRRTPTADTSVPPFSTARERRGSTTSSSSTSGHFSAPLSIESIGVAIAPPQPPPSIERPSPSLLTEDRIASKQRRKSETPNTPHVQTSQRFSMERFKDSADTTAERPNRESIPPAAPLPQRRRRRLSKSRPPSIEDSGTKMSIETVRPIRSNSTATPATSGFDFGQIDLPVQQKVEEPTVVISSEFVRKTPGKLTKNPDTKHDSKARWTSRLNPFGNKTPAIVAH
ncbi:hypothetical protein F5Y06DRAFT_292135 [Hypoxylon sp. FL0890]|nr:hypothetical protein F5Y06DRAFT_292135 [Hypoxylon sp. FL0890]